MTLEEFEARYPRALSPAAQRVCRRGILFMKRNRDGIHDAAHVFSLLNRLHGFLQSGEKEAQSVNIEIMALSVCWHDAWRAGRTPGSYLMLIFESWWDGWGSFFLFLRETKHAGLDPSSRAGAAYAIRKHAATLLPRASKESRLMHDIDILDAFSYARAKRTLEGFLATYRVSMSAAFIRFGASFLRWWLKTNTERSLYTEWAKRRFRIISPPFIAAVRDFLEQYQSLRNGKNR